MKMNENHYISVGLAITLVGVVAAGGYAWGQMDGRVKKLEDDAPKQDAVQSQMHEIDKKQGVLIIQQEQQAEDQKEFQRDTKDALKAILQKLDQQ